MSRVKKTWAWRHVFQKRIHINLVGAFNPFEKYSSNWEHFPNFRGEKKNIYIYIFENHHLQ